MKEKKMENLISATIEIMLGVAIALFLIMYGLNIVETHFGAVWGAFLFSLVLFFECILKAIFQKKQSEKRMAVLFAIDIILSCIVILTCGF